MHPFLFQSVPLYFVMWGCAIIAGVGGGTIAAARVGFPVRRSAAALLLVALVLIAGSKLLYLLEAHWFPADDYVPLPMRGALHGFRIPGGILLMMVTTPLLRRSLALPHERFGDVAAVSVAAALVFVRLGCFLNGCCFGRVSSLPWAVTFPRQSWVFWYQRTQGWINASADRSLPVHPLQLYFLLAAVAVTAVLSGLRARAREGSLQSLFYLLFFATTALLEPFRANSLTLNDWCVPLAAVCTAAVWIVRDVVASREAPVPVG